MLGCCLISFYFLWAILCPQTVQHEIPSLICCRVDILRQLGLLGISDNMTLDNMTIAYYDCFCNPQMDLHGMKNDRLI